MKLLKLIKNIFLKHQSEEPVENMSNPNTNLQKNLIQKNNNKNIENDPALARKQQSMQDSQGKNDFSGSGYNGPGNVDHEKRNSNMSQRNF